MQHLLKRMYMLLLCSTCMFKARLLLRVFMLRCFVTSAVDEHNFVRHTHTLLNMYLILFRFIANTNN